MKPTRYPKGVSTAARNSALFDLPTPDPTKLHMYFNDFDNYVAANWTVTAVGAAATQALTDGDGGLLLLTNDAADNDRIELQKVGESFLMEAGKEAWFKARFKVSDATQSDFVIGLIVTDTTLQGSVAGAGATDGIFFNKDDGDALLDVQCQKNATTGQNRAAGIATVADDTFLTVGWYFDGVSEVKYFVNDVCMGHLSGAAAYLPDTELTVSLADRKSVV